MSNRFRIFLTFLEFSTALLLSSESSCWRRSFATCARKEMSARNIKFNYLRKHTKVLEKFFENYLSVSLEIDPRYKIECVNILILERFPWLLVDHRGLSPNTVRMLAKKLRHQSTRHLLVLLVTLHVISYPQRVNLLLHNMAI